LSYKQSKLFVPYIDRHALYSEWIRFKVQPAKLGYDSKDLPIPEGLL